MYKKERSPDRRGFLQSALAMGAVAAFGRYLGGCSFPANYVQEHQLVKKTDASAVVAELKPGITKLDSAFGLLKSRGITNVIRARGLDVNDGNVTIDAVAGDNLYHVLLFRNNVFHKSLNIGADDGTATRIYLHIAKAEGSNAVIVVSPDLTRDGANVVAVLLDRNRPKRYFISTSYFKEWHLGRGMTDPLMNGSDLDGNGITFVARGIDGFPWKDAVILRCDGKHPPAVTRIDMQKVLHCECIVNWYWRIESKH